MNDAVIVAGARTAVAKSPRGALRDVRADDMAATVIRTLLARLPALDPADVDDVVMGCAYPEAQQGSNMGRIIALRAGLPHSVAGVTVNRFCSSGLQTIAQSAERIMAGFGACTIAGGAENMTQVRNNARAVPNLELARDEPGAYLSMGMTAENVATRYGVTREDQDAFALRSHARALAATNAGYFAGSIVPLACESGTFEVDEGPRSDTSAERLAALKPAFLEGGSVTAGNSSQTSDGAAAVVLMERKRALELGIAPLARFVAFAVAGVAPEVMGIGPIAAIPKALRLAGLSLADIDLIELNEAFASQALAVVRELDLDPERVNVNGGAIALGHPLGASGAKLTVQLLDELRRRGGRYGMVTMCVGGGQGAAGIFELLG